MAAPKQLVVLGGGVSGLSLAFFLRRQQPLARVRVLESAARSGGWVHTARRGGFLFEEGPRGFRPSRNGAEMLRLVEQLGLQPQVRAVASAASSRYILRDGRVEVRGLLSAAPLHMRWLLRTLDVSWRTYGVWCVETADERARSAGVAADGGGGEGGRARALHQAHECTKLHHVSCLQRIGGLGG